VDLVDFDTDAELAVVDPRGMGSVVALRGNQTVPDIDSKFDIRNLGLLGDGHPDNNHHLVVEVGRPENNHHLVVEMNLHGTLDQGIRMFS
jgi:hypothetical protein